MGAGTIIALAAGGLLAYKASQGRTTSDREEKVPPPPGSPRATFKKTLFGGKAGLPPPPPPVPGSSAEQQICAEFGLTQTECDEVLAALQDPSRLLESLARIISEGAGKWCEEEFQEEAAGAICEKVAEWIVGSFVDLWCMFDPVKYRHPWHQDGNRSHIRLLSSKAALLPGELMLQRNKMYAFYAGAIADTIEKGDWEFVAIKSVADDGDGTQLAIPVRLGGPMYSGYYEPLDPNAKTPAGKLIDNPAHRVVGKTRSGQIIEIPTLRERANATGTTQIYRDQQIAKGVSPSAFDGIEQQHGVSETEFAILLERGGVLPIGQKVGCGG